MSGNGQIPHFRTAQANLFTSLRVDLFYAQKTIADVTGLQPANRKKRDCRLIILDFGLSGLSKFGQIFGAVDINRKFARKDYGFVSVINCNRFSAPIAL